MKKIAGKVVEDDDCRASFEADAEKAVASLGITFIAEQVANLRKAKRAQGQQTGGRPNHLYPLLSARSPIIIDRAMLCTTGCNDRRTALIKRYRVETILLRAIKGC